MNRRRRDRTVVPLSVLVAALSFAPVQADCDTTAPVLTAFSFSPSPIDTTLASRTVTCNMTLTDALALDQA